MTLPPGAAPVIRDHGARILTRAALTLVMLCLVSGAEWIGSGLTSAVAAWTLLGVPASAGALLALGWRGVRMGQGAAAVSPRTEPERPSALPHDIADVAARLSRVVPISPVADLRPMLKNQRQKK